MRYNVGNMFDDVGKMRNDTGKLSNNVGKDGTTTWENCWKNAQHFWRNTACAEGGTKKCPRKGGMSLWFHSRGNGDVRYIEHQMLGYHKLDVQISQTRCLEFEHNTQGIIGAERLGY